MFAFIAGIPSRLRNLLSRFKRFFTKPQYDNFCRAVLGMIAAGKGEHDVKSMNQLFVERKDQSTLNRFFTESRWDIEEVVREGGDLLLSQEKLDESIEYKIVDDTVCRKYSPRTEMVCYNHSSTMGTVLSHDYVTSLYVNNDVWVQGGLRLYGNEKKCREKGVEFKTKVQLACQLIDGHTPRAQRTIWLWDSWYMVHDTVERCRVHGYSWIGEMKSNRIAFYESKRYRLQELAERLLSEGRFCDVVVDGEIYQACKVEVFIPKIGKASIVIDVKADTKDTHTLCTDLLDCSVEEIVGHALRRGCVDQFHKEAKFLGLGEYRFRKSEAALIHAHLVSLTHTLLNILRRRLLRYGIVKSLLSLEATVEWVRRKTMHLLIHRIKDAVPKVSTRSILHLIDTVK